MGCPSAQTLPGEEGKLLGEMTRAEATRVPFFLWPLVELQGVQVLSGGSPSAPSVPLGRSCLQKLPGEPRPTRPAGPRARRAGEGRGDVRGFRAAAAGEWAPAACRPPAALAPKTRDKSLIPRSGRSPGGGQDNPLQYCCMENPMDRESWWATVHRDALSRTCLK